VGNLVRANGDHRERVKTVTTWEGLKEGIKATKNKNNSYLKLCSPASLGIQIQHISKKYSKKSLYHIISQFKMQLVHDTYRCTNNTGTLKLIIIIKHISNNQEGEQLLSHP